MMKKSRNKEEEEIVREMVREILLQEGFFGDILSGIKTGVGKAYDVVSGLFTDEEPKSGVLKALDDLASDAPSNEKGTGLASSLSGVLGVSGGTNKDGDKLADAGDVVSSPGSYGFNTGGSGGRWSLTPYKRWCPPGSRKCRSMRPHYGVDLNRETNKDNAPLVAPLDGVVVNTGNKGACGYTLKIKHSDKGFTRYCHLKTPPIVNEGDAVIAGQRIGFVGSTGRSSGPHLHFETYGTGGDNINPLEWLSSNALYFPISMN